MSDDDADKVIAAIVKTARTGKIGDGKILISKFEEVVRFSTGDTGKIAI